MLRGSGRDEAIASAEPEIVALDLLAEEPRSTAALPEEKKCPGSHVGGKGLPGRKH
jgi:hypothetical protein